MDTHETKILVAFIAIVVVTGILVFFLFRMIINQQNINNALHLSKLRAEIQTLEKERKRIAEDLHDDISPVLVSIKYQLNALNGDPEDDKHTLALVEGQVDASIRQLRDVSKGLFPPLLEKKGLVPAIQQFIVSAQANSDLIITFNCNEDSPKIQHAQSIHLFRIVQEIVSNTLKHSGASSLSIGLKTTPQTVQLETADNGEGFDYHARRNGMTGLGLLNIASRADVLNASMHVDSSSGHGTRFRFLIHLNEAIA